MANDKPNDGDEEIDQYASPACLMHEVDAAYLGLAAAPDSVEEADNSCSARPRSSRPHCDNVRTSRTASSGGAGSAHSQ
jgi:hypothetical protein